MAKKTLLFCLPVVTALLAGCGADQSPTGSLKQPYSYVCAVNFEKTDDWGQGFVGRLRLTNKGHTAASNWQLTFQLTESVTLQNSWGGAMTLSGDTMVVKPLEWGNSLNAGQTVEMGFVAGYTTKIPTLKNVKWNGIDCLTSGNILSAAGGNGKVPPAVTPVAKPPVPVVKPSRPDPNAHKGGSTPPQTEPSPLAPTGMFHVSGNKLLDPNGQEFIMRGISAPFAYFKDTTRATMPLAAKLGFNTVRIVWCADNLQRSNRCDPKDMHAVSDLDKIIGEIVQNKMVPMLNLQNATGSDDPEHLALMVDYYVREDVKKVLNKYKSHLIINIANEWYGTWDNSRTYVETYKTAITRMRDAGLDHVLIIDARGWGQDFSSIPYFYKELIDTDSNIMMSAHMYDVFSDPIKVQSSFKFVRDHKIPFIVGEFACQHYPYQARPACDTIMSEADSASGKYGYIGWSLSGNSPDLSALDVLSRSNWTDLTDWGKRLVNGPNGIAASSQPASIFTKK
jgi:mannan endo-1,4-beta-mannosidase